MEPVARRVSVSKRQRKILQRLVDANKTPQQLAERARIVLMSAQGVSNVEQGEILDVDRQRVRRWRGRWADNEAALREAEANAATDKELEPRIVDILCDEFRSGAPAKFSAEQVAQILAVACESPQQSGLPISHWTPPDLTREIIKRGIVESISPRQVDRFLKGGWHPSA